MRIAKINGMRESEMLAIPKCVAVLWVGVDKKTDYPAAIAIVGDKNDKVGIPLRYDIKQIGDSVDGLSGKMATPLVGNETDYILFSERPKLIMGSPQSMPTQPGFER